MSGALKDARIPASAWAAQASSGRVSSRQGRAAVRGVLPDDRGETKPRSCLKCRVPFRSEGASNRICRGCIAQVNKNIDETR